MSEQNSNWIPGRRITPQRIGFVSTRFAGTDGVSLESLKWASVLEADRHECFWYAGRLDHPRERSLCIPEAFFTHPENMWIDSRLWGRTTRDRLVTQRIYAMAEYLKGTLYDFVSRYKLNFMVFENILTIPMHVPLGVAVTQFMSETHMPCIAHHHDFYWERIRFSVNAISDIIDMAFPSRDSDLHHVVINQSAQEELARRKGTPSVVIPNVLDFATPPPGPDAYSADLRAELGLAPGDVMILQPTRIVPRKGIEHAIDLVRMLGNPKYKLVVSHEAGDEGVEYRRMLEDYAQRNSVDLRFFATRVSDVRQRDIQGRKMYTLQDIYPHANLVTYPSLYEGFGNAFLEAIYFKVPVLVNRYAIFHRDIEPKGFRVPVMDGFLTQAIVDEVRLILEDGEARRAMTEHNYQVALRHYSYAELRRCLRTIILDMEGLYPS